MFCSTPGSDVGCRWKVAGGVPGLNFRQETASGGRVQFPGSDSLAVMLLNDPTGEPVEFTIVLYEPSLGARIDPKRCECLVRVKNYIPEVSVPINDPIIKVKQSDGYATIPLQRNITTQGRLSIEWSTTGDYEAVTGTVEFPDGTPDAQIRIPLNSGIMNTPLHKFKLHLKPLYDGNFSLPQAIPEIQVENDIGPGLLQFAKHEIYVKQTDDNLKLQVLRKNRFIGTATIGYRVETDDENSPYADVPPGILKFRDQEHETSLEIALEETAQDANQHRFKLVLFNPEKAMLDEENSVCSVIVDNDVSAGTVGFKEKSPVEIKQTRGVMRFTIRRLDTLKGMIKVPYSILASPDSPYFSSSPEPRVFRNGESKSVIELTIPRVPLPNPTDSFVIKLHKPLGGARLNDDDTLEVTVINDISK